MKALRNADGMVLVVTLVLLAIITAVVVEFASAVYMSTAALNNWRVSQRLALVSEAGVAIASRTLVEKVRQHSHTYPGRLEIPHLTAISDFGGAVSLRIEDENAKLNINTLVFANGTVNRQAFEALVRLLGILDLDPAIADRVVDWIDPDTEPRLGNSEDNAKNRHFDTTDELGMLPGMTSSAYERLMPYVTVFGNGAININGAEVPVLRSLSERIDREMAERIVKRRDDEPFEKTADIVRVAGFETLGTALMGSLTVKGTVFRITVTAAEDRVKKHTESVLEISEGHSTVRYWQER